MKINAPIEVSGIRNIVIKKRNSDSVYKRNAAMDWVRVSDGRVIKDTHMVARLRKMLQETTAVPVFGGVAMQEMPKYRPWIEGETINVEHKYYDGS